MALAGAVFGQVADYEISYAEWLLFLLDEGRLPRSARAVQE